MENKFYVYLHTRNDTGEVFYVGKGCGKRAWWKNGRNKHWHFIVNKAGYDVHIYEGNLSEHDAFNIEKERIQFYGRKNLCNYTDGGEATSGVKKTEAQKLKMREAMLGRKFSDETIKKMKQAAVIRNSRPDFQQKRVAKLIGKKHTKKHKQKIALSGIGRVLSKEARQKISNFHKGKPKNKDAVEKMAASKSKPVICLTNGITYKSMNEASRQLNVKQSKISDVVNGKASHAKGFVFVLAEQ